MKSVVLFASMLSVSISAQTKTIIDVDDADNLMMCHHALLSATARATELTEEQGYSKVYSELYYVGGYKQGLYPDPGLCAGVVNKWSKVNIEILVEGKEARESAFLSLFRTYLHMTPIDLTQDSIFFDKAVNELKTVK